MVNETSERQPDYAFIEKLLPQTGRAIDCLTNTFGLEHTSATAAIMCARTSARAPT